MSFFDSLDSFDSLDEFCEFEIGLCDLKQNRGGKFNRGKTPIQKAKFTNSKNSQRSVERQKYINKCITEKKKTSKHSTRVGATKINIPTISDERVQNDIDEMYENSFDTWLDDQQDFSWEDWYDSYDDYHY